MPKKILEKILGKPLSTRAVEHERLTNMQGLAIFGADALSSTAYATEEMLIILAASSTLLSFTSIPIALAIACLIFLIAVSYHQVIHAYPEGGGVYNVASKNLGEYPALIGAASLLVDYILTAAVSTTAGVAAITSAFPALYPNRIMIGIIVIIVLTWINLRGVKETGRIFSVPTYAFILTFAGMIIYGLWRFISGTFPISETVANNNNIAETIGILIILRTFAAGCTAMTGIEAVSNGVQAFQAPESKNASQTLMRMAVILGVIFVGITSLAYMTHIVPKDQETIISQIAHLLFEESPFYYLVQIATASILLLAANTPFAGFPRVASQLAKDGYFPRQFLNLGSRLIFANGIMLLALFSSILIYLFNGNVHALIPLYAVGVFLGFSISQLGMIFHWLRKDMLHPRNIVINTIGLIATFVVFIIVFSSKFLHGAWIIIPAITLIVFSMKKIKQHYDKVEKILALSDNPKTELMSEKTAIILVSRLNRGTLHALRLARSFQPARIRAVHVCIDQKEGEKTRQLWEKNVSDIPIDIIYSEYRDLIKPIIDYLKNIDKMWGNDSLIVFIPQIASSRWWHYFLHNQTNRRIQLAIEQDPDINPDIYEVTIKSPRQQKPLT